ncbi:MAG: hypothetical protein CMA31_04250 [Euryarchaeota archaeon]|nr:hypothetical protein [Euryarchaeota archaeon]RPG71941.1 MAG: hypothetical protein CBD52_003675 [Euryarchaeota archaeon TMED192]
MEIKDKREFISSFLERCVKYAETSLERKIERGEEGVEIDRWKAYRDFTAYSASEVISGALDEWLDGSSNSILPSAPEPLGSEVQSIDLMKLSHVERRGLIARVIGPRPVFLVGTRDSYGARNLAPMSSVSILSNTPPLIAMSLSSDKGGRIRDTYQNIENGGVGSKVSIHALLGDRRSAMDVEISAQPHPADVSEWDLISGGLVECESGDLLSTAIATVHAEVVEIRSLPRKCKASLIIMEIDSVTLASEDGAERQPRLIQISDGALSNDIGPAGWTHVLDW